MKKFYVIALIFLLLTFIFSGCAKKKITSPINKTSQTNTTLKQEDLTKKSTQPTQLTGNQTQNQNTEEYSINAQQTNQESGTMTGQKKLILPPTDRAELQKRIHFAFDSYELTPKAKEILKKKAEILLNYPSIKMIIEGHCDERGTEEYNLALGERRARAAYEYLILLGIEADRLSIVSYGEEKPLDPRHNEEAWAKNRRDEFRIVK